MRSAPTISILFVCFTTGSGLLSQKPQDSVAVAGKSAYFNCSTLEPSKPILWYHYAINEGHRENIYQYANFTDYWYPCYRNGRYVVERNPETGSYNLVIPMVLSSDAGRYLCEVEGDEGVATLTVQGYAVDSNLACEASEICKPYIKPYSTAIICIMLIILPIAIGGTIILMWYLCVNRQKKRNNKEMNEKQLSKLNASDTKILQQNTEADGRQKKSEEICLLALPVNTEASYKEIIRKLEEEVIQLKNSMNYLEQRLYPTGNIDYAVRPTFAHTITTDAGKERQEPIIGMAILGQELFVSHEANSLIEIYDLETFQYIRNWTIKGMSHPMDIASCKIDNCLYIIFREDNKPESESRIVKVIPEEKENGNWSTGGKSGRLSTYNSSVILCLCEEKVIKEFSGDGNLIHTVCLSLAVGLNHPWHAIKVSNSHFAVCHGDAKDELHRVCIINTQGTIINELKEWASTINAGKLNVPICLVEDRGRSILVADRDSRKIRRLNCLLQRKDNLITGLDGYPVRVCLDEGKGRLFVAENPRTSVSCMKRECTCGRVLVFNIKVNPLAPGVPKSGSPL